MTVDKITHNELITLWRWVRDNPELHQTDDGPKTFEEFYASFENQGISVLAVHKGHKFIGAVGIKAEDGYGTIRGIHFDESVRGSGDPLNAVAAVISLFDPFPVRLRYFKDNPYLPNFIKKLGGVNIDGGGSAVRNGGPVELQAVEFSHAHINADVRLQAS